MASFYFECAVPMIPDMDKADFVMDDEDEYKDMEPFEIPKIHYGGLSITDDARPMYDWKSDTITVKRGSSIVEFNQNFVSDVLFKDDDGGEDFWINGTAADILGYPAEEVVEFHPTTTYWVTEYNLEKAEKKRYKVVLEETLKIDMFDYSHMNERFN